MIKEMTLLKLAKVGLGALCGIVLIMFGIIFMLNLSLKDKVYSADMVLNSQKIVGLENTLEYNVRLKFPEFRAFLRSKSISNIHINKIAWDSAINTNALSNINQRGQNLWFNSTQDLSKLQSQSIGVMEYKIDFYPFMKNIIVYVILALLFIFALMSKNPSKYATNLALSLMIVALSMASSMTFWSKEFSVGTDSGVFQYIGQAIMRGEMPYRDAFDHKGALLYLYNYFGNLILKIRGVWIFEIVSVAVAVIFGYKMARLFLNRPLAIIAVMVAFSGYFRFVEGGNLTEQYALPFLFVSLYIFVRYFMGKISKVATLICGICFGAVCLLRPNMIALWAAFVALIFFMELKRHKFSFAIFFTLGFALIVVPILSWLYFGGAFREFIEQYLIFNLRYSGAVSFGGKFDMFFTFLRTEPLMILSFIFVALKAYKERQIFDYGFLAFIILTLLATSMSGRPYYHYRCVFLPIYIYGVVVFMTFLLCELKDCKCLRAVSVSTLILTLLISPFLKEIRNSLNTIATQKFLPNLAIPKEHKETIESILKYSDKNDKISVYGNIVAIYLMSDRLSASRLIYQIPIVEYKKEWFEMYMADLAKESPKIIIVTKWAKSMLDLSKIGNYKEVEKGIFVRE